jgi:hypothetical protein
MASYKYVVVGQAKAPETLELTWYCNPAVVKPHKNMMLMLNDLGAQGWRIVGIGEFGGSTVPEIILMKEE